MSQIRVFVMEDHRFFRCSLIHWLNQQPALTCCGEAGRVAVARRAIPKVQPDVLLLDLHLSEGNALDFVRELSRTRSCLRIIGFVRGKPGHGCGLPTGIHACVVKSEATETLLPAIESVVGRRLVASQTTALKPFSDSLPARDIAPQHPHAGGG
jgi:DNA-binding NarL/FixJ family response regulator